MYKILIVSIGISSSNVIKSHLGEKYI